MSKILVRAVDATPPSLRYLDGRTYLVRPGATPTEPGHVGTLHGIPGVLVEDAGQLVWEIHAPPPVPPAVQSASRPVSQADVSDVTAAIVRLGDELAKIREALRDAFREMRLSRP